MPPLLKGKLASECETERAVLLYEHQLHQQHIADRAAGDGNNGLVLPFVDGDGHGDGEGLRDAAAARKGRHALEAVDDEHPEDGGGQNAAQIPHHLRRLLIFGGEDSGFSKRAATKAFCEASFM